MTWPHTSWHLERAGLRSHDDYAASYSCLDPFSNLVTFNSGYHTAHHVEPERHWSELPAFHETISHRIPAHCYHDGELPEGVLEVGKARSQSSPGGPRVEQRLAHGR